MINRLHEISCRWCCVSLRVMALQEDNAFRDVDIKEIVPA